MWLIVGLGNPGKKYAKTRHNLGFMVADLLSEKYHIPLKYKSKNYTYGKCSSEKYEVVLIKPVTFMNSSGIAVRDALKKYENVDNLIVVHDDIDLQTGVIRIKRGGSAGGHRGVGSIIETAGTRDFIRVRIGIGRPESIPAEEYVLCTFNKHELPIIKKSIERAVEAIEIILDKGVSYSQNRFHRDKLSGDL